MRNDVGQVFIQLFDATLANHLGAPPPVCDYADNCGGAGLLEHTGDVYACDHFVSPAFWRGNILEQSLQDMLASDAQRAFGRAKSQALPQECRSCPVLFACKGDCPKNRFLPVPNEKFSKNVLCAGYKRFYEHSADSMQRMAFLVRHGRPANAIMQKHSTGRRATAL